MRMKKRMPETRFRAYAILKSLAVGSKPLFDERLSDKAYGIGLDGVFG